MVSPFFLEQGLLACCGYSYTSVHYKVIEIAEYCAGKYNVRAFSGHGRLHKLLLLLLLLYNGAQYYGEILCNAS